MILEIVKGSYSILWSREILGESKLLNLSSASSQQQDWGNKQKRPWVANSRPRAVQINIQKGNCCRVFLTITFNLNFHLDNQASALFTRISWNMKKRGLLDNIDYYGRLCSLGLGENSVFVGHHNFYKMKNKDLRWPLYFAGQFSLFSIVTFPNDPCTPASSSTLIGW